VVWLGCREGSWGIVCFVFCCVCGVFGGFWVVLVVGSGRRAGGHRPAERASTGGCASVVAVVGDDRREEKGVGTSSGPAVKGELKPRLRRPRRGKR